MIWLDETPQPNTHAAFRGRFAAPRDMEIELRFLGASWYHAWLDGADLLEGPLRYEPAHPEYQPVRMRVGSGAHVLAVHAHYGGLPWHRLQAQLEPFLDVRVFVPDTAEELSIQWKGQRLAGHAGQQVQINPLLGWVEFCDTRQNPHGWLAPTFDDSAWPAAVAVSRELGEAKPASIGPVRQITHEILPIAEGAWSERFGHGSDDIFYRFVTRDLTAAEFPQDGIWRRYDFGQVYLFRPRLVIDAPEGTEVEMAYGEFLVEGRVTPYILGGQACNMDHYVLRGGVQTIVPLEPRGGRYMEVHVKAPAGHVRFVEEGIIERTYHEAWQGAFECGEPMLERIWTTGLETYRSCAEDALTDNPTRERGQWTGDVVNVGMDIAAAAFGDVRIIRRALVQAAHSAREDGMVAAMSTGCPQYIASFAAQWTRACLRYVELTGDASLLEELYPHAKRNAACFEGAMTADGVPDGLTWLFLDWGYVKSDTLTDMTLNMFVMDSFDAMHQWRCLVRGNGESTDYLDQANRLREIIRAWLDAHQGRPGEIGYHPAALALRYGLAPEDARPAYIEHIKSHIADCFPNNPEAPMLGSPDAAERRVITPYFSHFTFPVLIESGEADFVLDQMRSCWGWALDQGLTTWCEVFDLRWSHCHVWSGAPTWILSRYMLGLHSRFDLGPAHFRLALYPGSLEHARGRLPLPGTSDTVEAAWRRTGEDRIAFTVKGPEPLHLHLPEGGVLEAAPGTELELRPNGAYWTALRK